MKKKDRERREKILKKLIRCPLCEEDRPESEFVHNSMIKAFIHNVCGIVFMNPDQVKEIQKAMKKNSKIIQPAKDIKLVKS